MNTGKRGILLVLGFLCLSGKAIATSPAAAPLPDNEILSELHLGNKAEIEAGQWAQDNASTDDIKAYGERLEKDHAAADLKVRALAGRLGIKLKEAPTPITASDRKALERHQARMAQLKSLKGAAFDRLFIKMMARDHQDIIHRMERQLTLLPKDSPVYDLIKHLLPDLREHYQMATSLGGAPK